MVNVLKNERLILVENKAFVLEHSRISSNLRLRPADGIVELVLKLHVLQSIVANQERSELFLVELDEPVNECAIDPGGWLRTEKVRGASAQSV